MHNKHFQMRRLKEKLWRHNALHMFNAVWEQLSTQTERNWLPIEVQGSWIICSLL